MNRNYPFVFTVLCLFSFTAFAQQQLPVPIHIGDPEIVNFAALAAEEATQPVTINRNFEADEEQHRGIPKKHPVPSDATRTIIDLPLSQTRTQSPAPVATFNGLLDNGTTIPPDVHGAVGLSHLMEMLNSQFRIFNKTGGIVSTLNVWTFYGFSSSNFYSDPRITYDPNNSRWISCINADVPGGHNGIYVAVSQTSDPTGSWYIYNVDVTGNTTDIIDYPSLGFNKDWIVITGNLFAGNFFSKVKILVFNKSDLYSGSAGTVNTFNDAAIFTLTPATTFDNTISTEYMLTEWNNNSGGFCYLKQYTITGSVNSPVYSAGSTVGTNQPYSQNSKDAPQSGSTNKISTGDTRMLSCVYQNGYLYAAQTVFLPSSSPNRSSAQWWKINPSNATVSQFGRVDDGTAATFYAFPSISVNANDDVLLSYSQFSSTTFASSSYSYRTANDAVNTLQTPYLYKSGLATYYKTFGGGVNRWGDYSATCLDPSDGSLWTLQEFASSPSNNWGTVWANVPASNVAICYTPSGLASSNVTATSADLSWGAVSGASSYTIQYKATSGSIWTTTTSTTTSKSISGLASSTQYEFQLQASCTNGSISAFSASAYFTTAFQACTDVYEPNNTKGKAKAITVGVSIQALISSATDKDFFKFDNTVSQPYIKITVTNLPADYDVKLFGPAGTKVASSENSGTNDESLIFNSGGAGTYKPDVYGYSGAFNTTQCYTLTAYLSSSPFKLEAGDGLSPTLTNQMNTIYPNPSTGEFNVDYSSMLDGNVNLVVFDLMGRLAHDQTAMVSAGANSFRMDLKKLNSGIYVLEIINGNEVSKMKFEIAK
ncbi:MAG: T9SS type A sorting domain-containing protein [Chitinophagales bacterium]